MVFSIIFFYADRTIAYVIDVRASVYIRKSVLAQHIRFCGDQHLHQVLYIAIQQSRKGKVYNGDECHSDLQTLLPVSLLTAVAFHMAPVARLLPVEVLYSEILNAAEDLVQFFAVLVKAELTQYRVIRIVTEEEEIILDPTESFTSI